MTNRVYIDRRVLEVDDSILTFQNGKLIGSTFQDDSVRITMSGAGVSGADQPGWRSLARAHRNATNSLSGKWLSIRRTRGLVRVLKVTPNVGGDIYTYTTRAGWLGSFDAPASFDTSTTAINRAKAQFISNARQSMSPFQGGVFLGELRETIELIHRPARSLFQRICYTYPSAVLRKAAGVKGKRRKEHLGKVVADTWLEYSFGWKPLIQDIRSGAEALARLLNYSRPLERVTGHGGDDVNYTEGSGSRGFGDAGINYNWIETIESDCRIVGGVDISPSSAAPGLIDLASFNWTDFVPTVWELIPYSFLVDYFTNIGDIISAVTYVQSKLVWLSQSNRCIYLQRQSGWSPQKNTGVTYLNVSSGEASMKVLSLLRSAPTTLVPSFQFNCPGVKSLRWLNIAALAAAKSKLKDKVVIGYD